MLKKILLILFAIFIIIQFFRPEKNRQDTVPASDITSKFEIPAGVHTILDKACFDCHSNNTKYPWYSNIQPVAWWLDNHIKDGKGELNFSEYTNKSLRYQYHKMEELIEQVKEGKMPLNSYTWIHKDAILTSEEKTSLTDWANAILDTMKQRYPVDSLVRKRN